MYSAAFATTCCVSSCPNHLGRCDPLDLLLPFPPLEEERERRFLWMQAVLNPDKARVCSRHFQEGDFLTQVIGGRKVRRPALRKDVLPSVNLAPMVPHITEVIPSTSQPIGSVTDVAPAIAKALATMHQAWIPAEAKRELEVGPDITTQTPVRGRGKKAQAAALKRDFRPRRILPRTVIWSALAKSLEEAEAAKTAALNAQKAWSQANQKPRIAPKKGKAADDALAAKSVKLMPTRPAQVRPAGSSATKPLPAKSYAAKPAAAKQAATKLEVTSREKPSGAHPFKIIVIKSPVDPKAAQAGAKPASTEKIEFDKPAEAVSVSQPGTSSSQTKLLVVNPASGKQKQPVFSITSPSASSSQSAQGAAPQVSYIVFKQGTVNPASSQVFVQEKAGSSGEDAEEQKRDDQISSESRPESKSDLTKNQPVICPICKKVVARKRNLYQHMRLHQKHPKCQQCGKEQGKVHICPMAGKTYKCGKCDALFMKKYQLALHLMKVHGIKIDGNKAVTCGVCQKTFINAMFLKKHLNMHKPEGPLACGICGKQYPTYRSLHHHQRIHIEKPHACNLCEYRSYSKSNLGAHMSTHYKAERPFMCEECGKTFTSKTSLKKHSVAHTEERPYQCNVCGKAFKIKSSLDSHTMLHTGEKPYKCEICDKAFAHRTSLSFHRRTHTGEKPFACMLCGKSFVHRQAMQRHIRIHTGEKPYTCEICGLAFRLRETLNKHLQSHAGQKTRPRIVVDVPEVYQVEEVQDEEVINLELKKHMGINRPHPE